MKRLFALMLIAVFLISPSIIGCGDDKANDEYDTVKTELDKVKEFQTDANTEIENLKKEIKDLEIEKQKLIAEKKRLEAEIIELKIKDYEKVKQEH